MMWLVDFLEALVIKAGGVLSRVLVASHVAFPSRSWTEDRSASGADPLPDAVIQRAHWGSSCNVAN